MVVSYVRVLYSKTWDWQLAMLPNESPCLPLMLLPCRMMVMPI